MSTTPLLQTQTQVRVRDPRRLLLERAAVLLRRVGRSVGRAWAQWRKQVGENRASANGGGLAAVMGRALSMKGARSRMLAVEERLTLGPKQHMYLIRCGEQRLLVASAGEGALQWMALPEAAGQAEEACCNTEFASGNARKSAKRSAVKSASPRKSGAGRTARAARAEGAR